MNRVTRYLVTDSEGSEGYVGIKTAKSWIDYGAKVYEVKRGGENELQILDGIPDDWEKRPIRIMEPDVHSHSWLVIDELVEVYEAYCKKTDVLIPEIEAIIAAMQALESCGEATPVFIYWFDS